MDFQEGYFGDISHTDYQAIEAIRASYLKAMQNRPRKANFRYQAGLDRVDSKALRLGRALHSYLLTPDDFAKECVVEPPGVGEKGKSRSSGWYQSWADSVPDDYTVIPREDTSDGPGFASFPAIKKELEDHPAALRYLSGGYSEVTIMWVDSFGLNCKCRLDHYVGQVIGDYKSTRDASPRSFRRDFFRLGYDQQAAFYLEGARAVGLPVEVFAFVAQEKEAPFEVAVYLTSDEVIAAGNEKNRLIREMIVNSSYPLLNDGEEVWIENEKVNT